MNTFINLHREKFCLHNCYNVWQVWKKIMTYVVDKADIESCSNASPYFGNLLYGKRYEEIVVPKTLSVLYKYYQNNSTDLDETNPMKDILNCRLLCKAWNRIIEGLHDDDERSYFEMKNELENPDNKNMETWVVDSFDNLSGAEKFLEHFNPTHLDSNTHQPIRNPFLGRYVHLFYDRNDGDNVHGSFIDMLKIYGQGIWYFSLFYHFPPGLAEQDGNRLVELYQEVCEMIRNMPRLRVFRFFYKEQIEEHEIPFDNRPTLQPSLEETLALNREIDRNPLPKFQNLECLVTVDLPSPIFNQLLHRNSADIRQMEITRKRFHQDYELFGAEGLPNLKTLSLEFLSVEDFKQFENCPLTFKLEKFHFLYDQSAEFLPWCRVFQALESKIDKDVCSEMVLQMPLPRNDAERLLVLRESLDCRLDFPKLKRILIFEQTALCLDFLLPAELALVKVLIQHKNIGGDGLEITNIYRSMVSLVTSSQFSFWVTRKKLTEAICFVSLST